MNTPQWICNQLPCRDIPTLKSKQLRMVRMMAYVYWGLSLLFAVGAIWYLPLLVFTGFFAFIGVLLLLWIKNCLRLCNTVEFYDDTIILRNHLGEVIRTVKYESVLYADVITLRFAGKYHRFPAFRAKGRYLCLWLTATPPLSEDDAFGELTRWEELFLFSYDENAEALLREKVHFT